MEHKKRKSIPLLLMLVAGIIAWTITYIFKYTLNSRLFILLFVLFVFYVAGLIIVSVLNSFDKDESVEETEIVIEKEVDNSSEEKEMDIKDNTIKEETDTEIIK